MPHTPPTPFDAMQQAVDIVNSSAHPTNKIAAALTGMDMTGGHYSIAMTNYWPDRIHARLGAGVRIGSSSATIHAETACILTAPMTADAALFITDPFCPNCAKNMAEAGIKTIYIDHKGFAKDFASRRFEAFDTMSKRICEKAGINVFEINRKEQSLTPVVSIGAGFTPVEERPVTVAAVEDGLEKLGFEVAMRDLAGDARRSAAGIARDAKGYAYILCAFSHPSIGFLYDTDFEDLEREGGKYSFMLEPLNRLLMNAARRGLKLQDGMLYSSQVPTSRELVNLIGAGLRTLTIGDRATARDDDSHHALSLLEGQGLLTVQG